MPRAGSSPAASFFETLGKVALSFQAAPQGVPGIVWNEISPWLGRLAINAAPKWLPRLMARIPCGVPVVDRGQYVGPCPDGAVAACDVCGASCCLSHCRIDSYGDGICYPCIAEAIRRRQQVGPRPPHQHQAPPPVQPAGPSADDVAWAMKILKLKGKPTLEQIHTAHRKLSGEHHPDRFQGEREKAKAEAKFKDVQRAAEVLKQVASATAA